MSKIYRIIQHLLILKDFTIAKELESMTNIDLDLLEKAEQLKAECGAAAAYEFLTNIIKLEIALMGRDGE